MFMVNKVYAWIVVWAIMLFGAYQVLAGSFWKEAPAMTVEQIEQRKFDQLKADQEEIDSYNFQLKADCHLQASQDAMGDAAEYDFIVNRCYQKGKRDNVLKWTRGPAGDKIYEWTSTGGIAPVPPRISNVKINEQEKITREAVSKGDADVSHSMTKRVRQEAENRPTAWDGDNGKPAPTARPGWPLEALGLEHCSIKQTEDEHIQKSSGHIYGTDIACVRGESFSVSAPQWKSIYKVKSVGYDKRLGNYIVLQHGNYMFVFGHTVSPHKVWDRIEAGNQIGYTDKSGIATNVHLHFELWRDGYNITHDEMLGRWSRWNDEYSYNLLVQRWWWTGLEVAVQFTQSVECPNGYSRTAYEDPKGSGKFSIGCGTWSVAGEQISEKTARERYAAELESRYKFVYKNRLGYTDNERAALTAFFYNLWYNRPAFIKAVRSRDAELESLWKSYVQPFPNGLWKRRTLEYKKFIQH